MSLSCVVVVKGGFWSPISRGGYTPAVAARGCLPPGANVCVAAHTNQISSAVRVFFRISNTGCESTLGSPLLFPPLSLPSLPSPLLSQPSIFHYFLYPPLEVSPLNAARKSDERCKLSQRGPGQSPSRN